MPGEAQKRRKSSSKKHNCCIPCPKKLKATILGAGTIVSTATSSSSMLTSTSIAACGTSGDTSGTAISFAGGSANVSGTISSSSSGLMLTLPFGSCPTALKVAASLMAAISGGTTCTGTVTLKILFTPTNGTAVVLASSSATMISGSAISINIPASDFKQVSTSGVISLVVCLTPTSGSPSCTLVGPFCATLSAIDANSTSSLFPFSSSCFCKF